MSRFNAGNSIRNSPPAPGVSSMIVARQAPAGVTNHQGGSAFVRTPKSELFLLGVTEMLSDTFYETEANRLNRLVALTHTVAVEDPAWLVEFVTWLRGTANMRTASMVIALEGVKALVDAKIDTSNIAVGKHRYGAARMLASAFALRADEPGEALAYWIFRYGDKLPMPLKRGIGDAVTRLYSEFSLLKYDTSTKKLRFGNVIDLVHPTPKTDEQSALFKFALLRMRKREDEMKFKLLPMVKANRKFRKHVSEDPNLLTSADALKDAGMTWEDALSLAGEHGANKRSVWEAMIPNMAYMALLRNLRNFDENGISDALANLVAQRIADPDQVARSRQLPLRFLSAYRNVRSDRWRWPLEQAIQASLSNIPTLTGRTLIMVDTSGSMHSAMSDKSDLKRWDAAVAFGLALASRCDDATVVSYSHIAKQFPLLKGESLLRGIERWEKTGYFIGGGTYTSMLTNQAFRDHNRIVILTDEQNAYGDSTLNVPAETWVHTFNLVGYQYGSQASGSERRHTVGGLTDHMFGLIPLLESLQPGVWPWNMTVAPIAVDTED